jgi:hypothetical protein
MALRLARGSVESNGPSGLRKGLCGVGLCRLRLRFEVRSWALERRPPQQGAAGENFRELWVAADELDEFNDAIIGRIEVIAEHRGR